LAKAPESYQASLEIDREIGYRQGEANSLGNIGNVYFQQGKLGQALDHYQRARDIFRDIGATIELQTAEKNIALVQAKVEAAKC
jgi:tetratricopeptide (TPR) repeat protein